MVFAAVLSLVIGVLVDLIRSCQFADTTSSPVSLVAPTWPVIAIGVTAAFTIGVVLGRMSWAPMTSNYIDADRERQSTARATARADRNRTIVFLFAFVVLLGSTVTWLGLIPGTFTATLVVVGFMLVVVQQLPNGAWLSFAIARLILAGKHHFPLRLIRFLDDGHNAGLFRGIPGGYQFCHRQLLDYLAQPTSPQNKPSSATATPHA